MPSQNFSNNEKTKVLATVVYANTPYLKKAKSYIPQNQMEGKKLGNKYKVYIPDAGSTRIVDAADGKAGLQAQVDNINEVEYEVTLKAGLNDCEVSEWNKLGDIESWSKEVAQPRGKNMARTIEKDAIESTVFRAAQAEVFSAADLDVIGDAAADLDMAGVVGQKATFIEPKLGAKIAKKALGLFNHPSVAEDLYKDKYLGRYAESDVVTESFMPTVVGDGASATISLTDLSGKGFAPVTAITTTAPKGTPFKANGLKLMDKNGIAVDSDYVIVTTGDNGEIPELRICVDGNNFGNANATVASGTSTLTLENMLTSGKKYAVVQTRFDEAVGFDSYNFGEIPGTKKTTESFEDSEIKVEVYEGGDLTNFTSLVRMVVPYSVSLVDPRESALSYVQMN